MVIKRDSAEPEREKTDESLRVERQKADQALSDRQHAVNEDADSVVRRARDEADAVLTAARTEADRRAAHSPSERVTGARAQEDEAIRMERASADDSVRHERAENDRALSRLVPLERELTDRYLLTERARSDSAIDNRDGFLGIVSHDLRNLLGGIVMSAAILSEGVPEGDDKTPIAEMTRRIQRYAARMNRLIGDLLDVASIDAGKFSVTTLPGDAAALIAEAVEMFQATASVKGVSLEARTKQEDPLAGHFDHDRMIQVLANLITNAIKFTSRGGRIRVGAERAKDDLCFSVTDTGAGIPDTMLEAVFQRFWQVHKSDQRGVGLGLYISRCIVEAHGGRIWALSKEGEGSTFSFILPGAARAS